MGKANSLIYKDWLQTLKTRPDLITIIKESQFDCDTYIVTIESDLIDENIHGMQVVVVKKNEDPLELKFIRDVDV
jgi:hypothetical protein